MSVKNHVCCFDSSIMFCRWYPATGYTELQYGKNTPETSIEQGAQVKRTSTSWGYSIASWNLNWRANDKWRPHFKFWNGVLKTCSKEWHGNQIHAVCSLGFFVLRPSRALSQYSVSQHVERELHKPEPRTNDHYTKTRRIFEVSNKPQRHVCGCGNASNTDC